MQLFLLLILATVIECERIERLHPTAHQRQVLQNTVKALLNFERLPTAAEVIRPVSKTANAASKYMRKLFDQYQSDGGRIGLNEGNIVRSISPVIGTYLGHQVLIFKLNKIKVNENVIRAELHYNLKHKTHKSGQKRRRVLVRAVNTRNAHQPLRSLPLDMNWLSWDALPEVKQILYNDSNQLIVQFWRRHRIMDTARLMRRHTPFLLIFSDASSVIDKEQMQAVMAESQRISIGSSDRIKSNRIKRNTGYYTYSNADSDDFHKIKLHVNAFQSSGPRILQSRKDLRRRRKQRKQHKQRKLNDELPYPDGEFGSFGNRYSATETAEDPIKKTEDVTVVLLDGQKFSQRKCAKRNLIVQFRDIGWEHWIIAPKSFEAHYCSGNCPFPLEKEVNPSNHAIVQSIIHMTGLDEFVPPVCCAPDKMDSLTLLYFDEDDNVVLKNYPKMTVNSCGCI